MHDLFATLAAWIVTTVQSGGYVGVAVWTLLENVFPPIPSEAILPVAGFLVSSGELSFVGVVVAATLGSVLGALVFYGLGAWLGEARLRAFVRRYGRWLALDETDLDAARAWFDRHGGKAVLLGRLVPSLRSLISVPAGVARMPLGRFALYTTVGSSVWNVLLVGAGWAFGDRWEQVKPFMSVFEWVSLVAVVGSLAWWLFGRRRSRNAGPTSTSRSVA
jgi:membrane protein DedA with SNARE-associated domain